jgi:hypothetical protein
MADIIPQQTSGTGKDNRAQVEFSESKHARAQYEMARVRLLDVNHWGDMSGYLSASFQLFSQEGKQAKNRLPMTGAIGFGLVNIPVKLYNAIEESELSLDIWLKPELVCEVKFTE